MDGHQEFIKLGRNKSNKAIVKHSGFVGQNATDIPFATLLLMHEVKTMFWFWLLCAVLVGIASGMLLGSRGIMLLMQPGIVEQKRNAASDRNFVLSVLRRELANWMFQRDPDRYRQAYKAAYEATAAIVIESRAEQKQQFAELAEQYPFYADFDLIDTCDYVLYADALDTKSYDDVELHYIDIIRFQTLKAIIDKNWSNTGATSDKALEYLDSDKALEHLDNYILQFRDRLFKARMEEALREFKAYRLGKKDDADPDMYETAILAVRPVAHFAEVRYGIHFKDTNEFGLYGIFYADDRDKPFTQFYRSNSNFTEEICLRI